VRWRLVVLGWAAVAACSEPQLTEANSGQAARACRDAMRVERDDPTIEVVDENDARIEAGVVTATYRIDDHLVDSACEFTFDRDTQRYEVLDTGLPSPG
jgi:hypothetical protein